MRHRSLLILTTMLTTGALDTHRLRITRQQRQQGQRPDPGRHRRRRAPDRRRTPPPASASSTAPESPSTTPTRTTPCPACTSSIKALDDKALPPTGQQNATSFVANNDVLGVVGPLNSGVAQSMQQVFATANLVEISPSNTAPELTQGKNWQTAKKRPYKTYFRTATTDALQGGFAAQYAYNNAQEEEGLRRRRQADLRRRPRQALQGRASRKAGGKVAGEDHVNTGDKDFSALVTKIKNSGADLSTTAASTTSPRSSPSSSRTPAPRSR